MIFNGKQPHWSTPFEGRRASIVYFAHSTHHALPPHDRDRLLKYGFGCSASRDANPGEVQEVHIPKNNSTPKPGEDAIVRNFVQGCCEEGSLMTRPTPYTTYCKFIEITMELDMRTQEAINMCIANIRGPQDTFFWCSPCTGGSQRQIYNIQRAFQAGSLVTLYKIWAIENYMNN